MAVALSLLTGDLVLRCDDLSLAVGVICRPLLCQTPIHDHNLTQLDKVTRARNRFSEPSVPPSRDS